MTKLGEFELIDELARRLDPPVEGLGIGDDAAAWTPAPGTLAVATTDMLIEGIHFRFDWTTPRDLGWKALAVNLSDLAAMGARPGHALISLALQPGQASLAEEMYEGIHDLAVATGTQIVGGDTVRTPGPFIVNVALFGEADPGRLLLRNAAEPGDLLVVTGPIGASAAGLQVLLDGGEAPASPDAAPLLAAHHRPFPQLEAGSTLARLGVRCAIDVSDGLASEARHIARSSGVAVELAVDALPLSAEAVALFGPEQSPRVRSERRRRLPVAVRRSGRPSRRGRRRTAAGVPARSRGPCPGTPLRRRRHAQAVRPPVPARRDGLHRLLEEASLTAEAQPLAAPRDDLGAATVGVEPVPARYRVLGFLDHFVLWADLGVGLLVLLAGSALVPGLGLWQAFAAIAIGTVVGGLMLGMAGVVGSDNGIPSMVSLRPAFGRRGSYLPSLVNVVQLVGWGAFEIVVMAQASARLTGSVLGSATYTVWVLIWGAVVLALALGGPLVVVRQWLEKFGIWLVFITVGWIAVYAFGNADFPKLAAAPGDGSLGFAQAVDLVVAMPISWLPLVADFNRFARDSRSSFAGTVAGFGLSNMLCYGLGALLILVLASDDLIGSILSVAFGAAGLALLLGDETDNAFADVYSGAISIKNVVPAVPTRGIVAVVAAVCVAIALTVDLGQFQDFLYLVGSLFTPLFGVLFADYFILRRRRYDRDDLYPSGNGGWLGTGVNPAAMLAWASGVAVYLVETTYVGWLGGTLPSLAAALVVYVALGLVRGRHRAAS